MIADTCSSYKDAVVKDALRITAVLNKHLSEGNCQHSVKEIVSEASE